MLPAHSTSDSSQSSSEEPSEISDPSAIAATTAAPTVDAIAEGNGSDNDFEEIDLPAELHIPVYVSIHQPVRQTFGSNRPLDVMRAIGDVPKNQLHLPLPQFTMNFESPPAAEVTATATLVSDESTLVAAAEDSAAAQSPHSPQRTMLPEMTSVGAQTASATTTVQNRIMKSHRSCFF